MNPIIFMEFLSLAKEIGFHFLEKRAGKPITQFTDQEAMDFIIQYRKSVLETLTDDILGPPKEEPK
jgi:hypothetical protein